MTPLQHRVAALEQKTASSRTPQIIRISGGLPGDGPECALVDDLEMSRTIGETASAFETRVMEKARACGAMSIIIGGLPN
jgi:hypothetical protein